MNIFLIDMDVNRRGRVLAGYRERLVPVEVAVVAKCENSTLTGRSVDSFCENYIEKSLRVVILKILHTTPKINTATRCAHAVRAH